MKLKHSIYLMIILCSFVPVCLWIIYSIYDTRARMEEVVSDNIEAIAGSHVMSIENFLEGRKESMETIAQYEVIHEALLGDYIQSVNHELNRFLSHNKENKSFMASLSVVDKDFHIVGSSEMYDIYGISQFKYLDSKYHSGEFFVGNIYERETDEGMKRIIPAYVGIYHDGELIGYLIEEIECEYFDGLRLKTDFLEGGTLYLLDGKLGLITAGTGEELESREEMVSTEEERQNYQEAWDAFDHETYSSGRIHYSYDGQMYMTYFSDIQYCDWSIRVTENMSARWKANRSVTYMLILEAVIMILALVGVQVIITRRLVAPLNKMVNTLKEIRVNHDYSLRTRLNKSDEVGMIANGIDDLLEFIEEEELNEKRKQREFAEEALLRAEASNRAKSTFLFNASHDIRTPMNAIQGFARIIEDNSGNEKVVKDSVIKIRKSSDTLLDLLNNVLELSQIESGKDEIQLKVINLNDFMEKLHMMFAEEVEKSGIEFEIRNEIQHPIVKADELKCTRILMNMLGNARKFTPAGGKITFGVQEFSGEEGKGIYRFYVRDTGIGMSEEFQERAFEQFETERTSTVSGVTGNGLGLAIIKKLVLLMGGTYDLQSTQGVGTEISVRLKLFITKEELPSEMEKVVTKDFTGLRVLLVEDNEFNREIATYILEEKGIEVEEAKDGLAALRKLQESSSGAYDVVLMDIQMPIMGGYEATKAIRSLKNKKISNIPIIAMTANAFKEDRDKCLEVGMNEHIGKPIKAEVLFKVLQEIL